MKVTLKFKNIKGERFKLNKHMSVKEAKLYYKKHFEKDDTIVKVWLTYFGTWHEHTKAILKGTTKRGIL